MRKNEQRNIIRKMKRHFDSTQLDEMASCIIAKLKEHPRFVAAHTIMLYHSLPDEVDTRRLIAGIKDKTIVLPRVTGEREMELRLYTGPDDLQQGAYGIMEPCGPLFTRYCDIQLAVIPGMAFDKNGNRLGRGKGYYDRFLPQLNKVYKIGICFDFQLVETVMTEPTDIPMDEVICN